MKVLIDNYSENKKNSYPKTITCEECFSELEFEKSDVKIGAFGIAYVECPLCGYDENFAGDNNCVKLTYKNIEYPTHFHHTCVENGAVDICNNKEIKEIIKNAINFFRENKDEDNYFYERGNLYVNVARLEDDEIYNVIVSNNYYETEITFEKEDY